MTAPITYLLNKASALEITEHLARCDGDFVPPLSGRVVIEDYARQIACNAMRFEAWSGGTLVGLVAVYCNDRETRIAYITSVSVLRAWTGNGIAERLTNRCIEYVVAAGFHRIRLEVASDNIPAIRLYEKCGFVAEQANRPFVTMGLLFE
jgi:ribosomal protein S18 acetylase RimI-like enzyme